MFLSFLFCILVHSIQRHWAVILFALAAGARDEIETHPIESERVEGGERMVNRDLLDPCFKGLRFS